MPPFTTTTLMPMNRYLTFVAAALAFLAAGCVKPVQEEEHTLSVTPESLSFTADGGTEYVEVRTNAGSWTLEPASGSDWCEPERTSGNASTTIWVKAPANPEGEARTATLTFSAPGCEAVELRISQEAAFIEPEFEGEAVVPAPQEWDGEKRAAISYQALVYSFADSDDSDRIGDFRGLTSKLDYLDELGVSAIWLSPIHPSSSYHGYDVLDYAAVNPAFGSEADLQTLIDEAHSHGIKIYLDYVLNHSSKDHPWFLDAKASPDSPYRDYYVFSDDPAADIAAGRIDQIATEGTAGYDAGQWFPAVSSAAGSQKVKFTLSLDGDGKPETLTVEQVDEISNTGTRDSGIYLYYGDALMEEFYTDGTMCSLSLDFESSWGLLIRTSTTEWDSHKYGAPSGANQLSWGEPLTLTNNNGTDILMPGARTTMYHSHFWTDWFADLNYGKASECEQSGAFAAVTEAADKWVEMGVDGFRLDAVKHIYHNQNSDENPTFLKKFYDRMNESYHAAGGEGDFYMVGEMLDEAQNVAPYYKGLPALFEFSFWYRLKWALQNGTGCYFMNDILGYQDLYRQYRADYIEATKLSNHDEDRAGSDLGQDVRKMKMAAAVLLTAQGEPYIYQGEELGYWGTKNNGDEYVRTPIMWNADGSGLADGSLSGKVDMNMLSSEISVESQESDEESILNVYRTFGSLRNTYPALALGLMEKHPVYNDTNADAAQIAAWYMSYEGEKMLVIHNFGEDSFVLDLPDDDLSRPVALMGTAETGTGDDAARLLLGGLSSVVFEL